MTTKYGSQLSTLFGENQLKDGEGFTEIHLIVGERGELTVKVNKFIDEVIIPDPDMAAIQELPEFNLLF